LTLEQRHYLYQANLVSGSGRRAGATGCASSDPDTLDTVTGIGRPKAVDMARV
jgi:hypothetical protein